MALFRGIQEYIDLEANNITLVFDSGNIVATKSPVWIMIHNYCRGRIDIYLRHASRNCPILKAYTVPLLA